MRHRLFLLLITHCSVFITYFSYGQRLQKPVEIIRDKWGVAHIYAQNEHDLFWAQGYSAAQDRLFQLEIWRRQATGTVAELLGYQEVKRDIGTRLFKFTGSINQELLRYHPHGPQIVGAFVEGINAYIAEILKTPEELPVEFRLLNTKPGFWTPDIVVSRHQGLLSNVRDELNFGRLAHLIGPDKLRELQWFHPQSNASPLNAKAEPDLTLHVNGEQLMQPILELYEAFRLPIKFAPNVKAAVSATDKEEAANWLETEKQYVGSNNWVVSGAKTSSGYPMLANDPHRAMSVPSLRYMVHLHAPDWNVIGAGEPTLPGISIGHNDYGAWGLTIFDTDNEDLYVYDTNPRNPNQYRYKNAWVNMTARTETIPVRNAASVTATLRFTRHGPVVFEDAKNHKAYAVRAGWLEPGCSPYLASLRMNQAKSWTEFRAACTASRIPGENMIWADKRGNIGWQAVGLAPVRPNWTGLVPVPGDGRYEWAGYLPIQQLPNKFNPAEGFIATANNNLTASDFPHRNAIGWVWAGPSRAHRIEEVLGNGQRKTMTDMMALQADYLSLPARTLVPLLADLSSPGNNTENALGYLRKWDFQLAPNSISATIYVAWETQLRQTVAQMLIPEKARPYLKTLPLKRVLDYLNAPTDSRDSLLLVCLTRAVADLTARIGNDPAEWGYGQTKNKHITITHPLSALTDAPTRQRMNLGPVARGGSGETVNATSNELNQTHGASFRLLVDTEDWDKTLGINTPGQSGDPASPHYRDLFDIWGRNGYFPLYFSRQKIQTVAGSTTVLKP